MSASQEGSGRITSACDACAAALGGNAKKNCRVNVCIPFVHTVPTHCAPLGCFHALIYRRGWWGEGARYLFVFAIREHIPSVPNRTSKLAVVLSNGRCALPNHMLTCLRHCSRGRVWSNDGPPMKYPFRCKQWGCQNSVANPRNTSPPRRAAFSLSAGPQADGGVVCSVP